MKLERVMVPADDIHFWTPYGYRPVCQEGTLGGANMVTLVREPNPVDDERRPKECE